MCKATVSRVVSPGSSPHRLVCSGKKKKDQKWERKEEMRKHQIIASEVRQTWLGEGLPPSMLLHRVTSAGAMSRCSVPAGLGKKQVCTFLVNKKGHLKDIWILALIQTSQRSWNFSWLLCSTQVINVHSQQIMIWHKNWEMLETFLADSVAASTEVCLSVPELARSFGEGSSTPSLRWKSTFYLTSSLLWRQVVF